MNLNKLVSRGNVSITDGQLVITPASGQPVPCEWLKNNQEKIIKAVLKVTGKDAFEYMSHSTGRYGKGRYPGVTLQFASLTTGETVHAVFNCELNRKRNTKHGKSGQPLPAGQFRVSKHSAFYAFWVRSGLAVPTRHRFHCSMGRLGMQIFRLNTDANGKAINKTIQPLNISHDEVTESLAHKERTSSVQGMYKERTTTAHKKSAQYQATQGIQQDSGTCENRYGIKVKRGDGDKEALYNHDSHTYNPSTQAERQAIPPQEQTTEEWLRAYDDARPAGQRLN